jgi:hypothetical protein
VFISPKTTTEKLSFPPPIVFILLARKKDNKKLGSWSPSSNQRSATKSFHRQCILGGKAIKKVHFLSSWKGQYGIDLVKLYMCHFVKIVCMRVCVCACFLVPWTSKWTNLEVSSLSREAAGLLLQVGQPAYFAGICRHCLHLFTDGSQAKFHWLYECPLPTQRITSKGKPPVEN